MFEARRTDDGQWGVWEHGVERWLRTPDGLTAEGARAIAAYSNHNRVDSGVARRPDPERGIVHVGGDWLSCEVHDRLSSPDGRLELRVLVWVDEHHVVPATNPPVRVSRGTGGSPTR